MLIYCEGCGGGPMLFESTTVACPVCGRCPCCGDRRVSRKELAQSSYCSDCDVPYCTGCGRCHSCGQLLVFEVSTCDCGHPHDPQQLASIEKAFGLKKRPSRDETQPRWPSWLWNPFSSKRPSGDA